MHVVMMQLVHLVMVKIPRRVTFANRVSRADACNTMTQRLVWLSTARIPSPPPPPCSFVVLLDVPAASFPPEKSIGCFQLAVFGLFENVFAATSSASKVRTVVAMIPQ